MNNAASSTAADAPVRELVLSGPSHTATPDNTPVRGDLAHIRLAGQHFVPHYAVPMPHRATEAGATVRAAANEDAEARSRLEPGSLFAVLDIAGHWAWGQVETDDGNGAVGYVALNELEQATA